MEVNNIALAFTFTLFAGLSTGIGGFSAGVMIYVSLIEIFSKAKESLVLSLGASQGYWATVIAFFGGMILAAIIDRFVPEVENPHEIRMIEETLHPEIFHKKKLLRMGLFSALAIGIHNFPEGLATFTATLKDPHLGIAIAIAIAVHNIPEGIAVSVPIYYATGSKRKAFILSFLSGLAEPAGALIGYLILTPFFNDMIFGVLFASVAGIMVFISVDELLPAAREYGKAHLSIYGLIAGMIIMAVSLLLFV
jgi:ZIP family zinc transporter